MLSLRSFARSAPKTASQIAKYSLLATSQSSAASATTPTSKATFRPATFPCSRFAVVQLSRCQAAFNQPTSAAASFSTSRTFRDDTAQELAAKLTSEIQLESEDSENSKTESDTNVKNFLDQGIWELVDEEGNQEVKLTRKYDDESIEVSFSIVDFNTPVGDPQEEMDEALMDEDDEAAMDGQSGGANTKGSVNQGRTSAGNMKVAPEDSIAPADREEMRNDEVCYYFLQLSGVFPVRVS